MVHEFDSCPSVIDALDRFSTLPECLLLESSRQSTTPEGKHLGRYSFLMADPVEYVRCRSIEESETALNRIDQWVDESACQNVEGLPPMQGGVAGLFSYDLNRAFEDVDAANSDEFEVPLIAVGLYDVVLAWDHECDRAWLIAQNWNGDAVQRKETFLELLHGKCDEPDFASYGKSMSESISLTSQHAVPGPPGLKSNFSKESYVEAVAKAIDYIYAGDVFQVNLAQRLTLQADCHGLELYHRLRQCNPAPFAGYFDIGDAQIISASPERFVSVRDGVIETRPIKGTRVRTGQPMVDIDASRRLLASEKDRAENTMIVDLMRNDLSRICTDDTVKVTQFCEIENYQSVMHLVSAVEGELVDGRCQPSELLRAVFPGGSITGAPKVRAMEIIAELEPHARGAYCGSLGYFSANGSVDLNILIRTITASGGWWQIPVGGGIVSQSNPLQEYEETWTKAASMLGATHLAQRSDTK